MATELSPQEERHLLNLSVIPAALVTYAFLAIFIYLERNQPSFSSVHYLIYFGMPFSTAITTTIFLSFEILYSRKAKQPLKCGARRFLGRMSLVFLAVTMLAAILAVIYFVFRTWFDENILLLVTTAFWFGVWASLMFRFKEAFNRLSAGKW